MKDLVLLDLDRTLVYVCYDSLCECSIKDTVMVNGKKVHIRPFLYEFIVDLFENYNVGIWTASTFDYCIPILKAIFKEYFDKLIFIIYRKGNNSVTKTLDYINIKHGKIIIVDDVLRHGVYNDRVYLLEVKMTRNC